MNVRMKFDTSKVQAAIKRLAPLVKKSRKELVEQAAKGFVRNVASITPPASKGTTGTAAKRNKTSRIRIPGITEPRPGRFPRARLPRGPASAPPRSRPA